MASTHFDSHLPPHRALVDVAANDSLSHECPNECTDHIVDDSRVQGVTAELTVSRHVVVSEWSKSFLSGFFEAVGSLSVPLVISIRGEGFTDVLSSPTSRVRGERCCHIRCPATKWQQ